VATSSYEERDVGAIYRLSSKRVVGLDFSGEDQLNRPCLTISLSARQTVGQSGQTSLTLVLGTRLNSTLSQ
jgi:hypothetical protein